MGYANEKSDWIYDLDDDSAGGVDIAEAVRSEEIDDYKVRLYKSGPMLEIEAYPVFKKRKEAWRAARAGKTSRKQAEINDRNARLMLERTIQINFREWHSLVVGLDYEYAPTYEQFQRDLDLYIRDCRNLYKKEGVEFKWLAVSPWFTKTGRPSKRPHHHIILPGGMDEKKIRELWLKRRRGRVHIDPLQPDGNGVAGLAAYINGHAHGAKRWTGSRNLIKPKPKYPRRHMSKKRAYDIARDYEAARTIFERKHKDYNFVSMRVYFSELVDGAYIYVRMRRKDAWKTQFLQ